MARSVRLLRYMVATIAVALAVAVAVFPGELNDRVDDKVLLLLAAGAIFVLVPWEYLSSLTAGPVQFEMARPQISGAVRGIRTGYSESRRVRAVLEKHAADLETIRGGRVLWIDDYPNEVLGERRLLRALGVDVIPVRSSEEALEELDRDNDVDLIISDLQRSGDSWADVAEEGFVGETESANGDRGHLMKNHAVVWEIHEGVNFVLARLRRHADPVIRAIPVVFYASYDMKDLANHIRLLPHARSSNTVDGLLDEVIPALSRMRQDPIEVPRGKRPTSVEVDSTRSVSQARGDQRADGATSAPAV